MYTPSSFRDVSNRRLILLGIGNFSHCPPQPCCSRCLFTLCARASSPKHAETVLRYRCEMCEGSQRGGCSSSLGERHGEACRWAQEALLPDDKVLDDERRAVCYCH